MKLLLTFLLTLPAWGTSGTATESKIFGPWHLNKWLVVDQAGKTEEFCKGAHGILLYEESGYVATAINCPSEKPAAVEPADKYDRVFFYAGGFEVRDGVIYKQVANSTAKGLIGKTVLRRIEKVSEKELILTGPFGTEGGSLWIRWTRP